MAAWGHLYVDGKKMSKSIGNVLYIEDLTDKGFSEKYIRFFLIYGAYRKRRNFTWQNLAETSHKLDDFKDAIGKLRKANGRASTLRAKTLAHSVAVILNKHMNNDLDVRGTFDALHKLVSRLVWFALKGELSIQEAGSVEADLREVDRVLQVIF